MSDVPHTRPVAASSDSLGDIRIYATVDGISEVPRDGLEASPLERLESLLTTTRRALAPDLDHFIEALRHVAVFNQRLSDISSTSAVSHIDLSRIVSLSRLTNSSTCSPTRSAFRRAARPRRIVDMTHISGCSRGRRLTKRHLIVFTASSAVALSYVIWFVSAAAIGLGLSSCPVLMCAHYWTDFSACSVVAIGPWAADPSWVFRAGRNALLLVVWATGCRARAVLDCVAGRRHTCDQAASMSFSAVARAHRPTAVLPVWAFTGVTLLVVCRLALAPALACACCLVCSAVFALEAAKAPS